MEYAQFRDTVDRAAAADVDEVYADLMAKEANTLRIVERVAADARRDVLRDGDVWNTSIRSLLDRYVDFWAGLYGAMMRKEQQLAMLRIRSPDGMFNVGITVLLVTVVLLILT
jgi:hypothetical protein